MRRLFTCLLFGAFAFNSIGQTRLNITSGGATIFQTGFYLQNNSNISFVTDLSDHFSLSLGLSVMTPRKIDGRKDFTKCDSFEPYGGWYPPCADGYLTSANSAYYYTYKKSEFSAYALWRRGTDNRNFIGLGVNGIVFSRQLFIEDPRFDDERLETGKAIAVVIKHIYLIPIFKPASGIQCILNLEGGLLYSHQNDCTDVSCDNFFEGESLLHVTGTAQLGIAIDLN